MPDLRAPSVTEARPASPGDGVLRFLPTGPDVEAPADRGGPSRQRPAPGGRADPAGSPADRWLVLDPAWTAPAGSTPERVALREVVAAVLGRADLFPTTTELLDDWADASGIVTALTVDGTSF